MSRKKVLIIARSFPTGRMEERMEFKQSLRVLQYFLQTEQNLSYFSIVLQIQAKKSKIKSLLFTMKVFVGGKIPIPTLLPIYLIRTLMTMQLKEWEDFQFRSALI